MNSPINYRVIVTHPQLHLSDLGIKEPSDVNQIANFFLWWNEMTISPFLIQLLLITTPPTASALPQTKMRIWPIGTRYRKTGKK